MARPLSSVPPQVVDIDLTVAHDRTELVPPGRKVAQYVVTFLYTSTVGTPPLKIHEGNGAPGIAMAPNLARDFADGAPWTDGLYFTNAALAVGSIAQVAILFATGE